MEDWLTQRLPFTTIDATGEMDIWLTQRQPFVVVEYTEADVATLHYRTGATVEACEAATWTPYTVPFESLGYVQVRVRRL